MARRAADPAGAIGRRGEGGSGEEGGEEEQGLGKEKGVRALSLSWRGYNLPLSRTILIYFLICGLAIQFQLWG